MSSVSPTPDGPTAPDRSTAPNGPTAPDPLTAPNGPAADSHLLALQRDFRLTSIEPMSLTRFARVHRAVTSTGEHVVAKVTDTRAEAMARWTRALADAGVTVVSAVAGPLELDGDQWVLYPFIDGESYTGTTEQIRSAGDLLGRLHAAHVPTDGLRAYSHPDTERADVDSDLGTLRDVITAHLPCEEADAALAGLTALADRWWEHSWPALRARDAELPRTGVSSDYKASNVVFTPTGPVLVDPDNGGVEPRLLDLAMALVLFHCECPGAPARMMNHEEWEVFARAYGEHVTLTPAEHELWSAAVDHMWWEEGTWVLEDNDEQAWADPVQGGYLRSLALWDPSGYRLP